MTDDLVQFLRDRYDDEARIAGAATPGPWRHDPAKHHHIQGTPLFEEAVFAGPPGAAAVCVAGTGETDDAQSMRDAAHIAAHHPGRVLADIEAKRGILEAYEDADAAAQFPDFSGGVASGLEDALRLLALPYADHRDYREEWRP